MKRFIVSTILSGALLASTFGGAFAASDNHSVPGVPGTPNCVGQTTAFLAQGVGVGLNNGIEEFADLSDATVPQVHELIQVFCAGV